MYARFDFSVGVLLVSTGQGVPMSSATAAHTGPGLSEDQYSRAVVPVGDTVDGPAAVEARLDSRMDGVVDRGTLRSEGSNVSEMEEFLTPGATALEVMHQ